METLYPLVMHASGMVFASPSYWGTMTAETKKFIERLTPLTNNDQLMGKVAACIGFSKENQGGIDNVALDIARCLLQMGFIFLPYSILWAPGGDVSANAVEPAWAFSDAPHVGKDMVRYITLLQKHPIPWFAD